MFGEYWVGFSKATAVGKLIDQGSETLIDRIKGLDEMHERIQLTMPHLNPPSFDFEEMPDGNHRLHYISNRDGLAPMVIGLLQGMAKECGVGIAVELASKPSHRRQLGKSGPEPLNAPSLVVGRDQ